MDAAQGPRLGALPTEILWRIARHCPAETCLNLTQVSRHLRTSLYDRLVFREIIIQSRLRAQSENLLIPKSPESTDSPRTTRAAAREAEELTQLRSIPPNFSIERLEKLLGDDLQAWIRVAVAESKAYQINKELPAIADKDEYCSTGKALLHGIYKYGTVLSTLHHPWVYGELVTKFLASRISSAKLDSRGKPDLGIGAGDDVLPALSFNICAAALSNPKSVDSQHTACKIIADTSLRCEEEADSPDSTATQFALAACTALLETHLDGEPDSDPQLPRIQDLPWITDIEKGVIPLPCAPPSSSEKPNRFVSWSDWESDCIHRMTDPNWLEDGYWCGYWSFDGALVQGVPRVQFADAVEGLVFRVHRARPSDRGPTPHRIRALYPNSGHNFHLEGEFTRDGQFTMGPPGDFWVWRGRMTPFGMFGFWGSTDWSRVAGICWLWKKSWSDAAREEKIQRKQSNGE
ncbi:hypothetical protein EV356DRAFT_576177 [Viridothelium virens]|uniref:F-box domain-containing protein n=1 Tax=Viridothelium virens TaxID=1048519 RepID=A0A6A6HAD7_VIRVR|nr:hypothetical protein EV356DRAFT_576177 [Viridothelium virens]